MIKKLILIFLVQASVSCSSSDVKQETIVVDAFFASCYQFAGDKRGFLKFLDDKKVAMLPEENSKYFLKGRVGEAWGTNISGSKVVLTWLEDGTCSFIVKEVDVDRFVSVLNSKLSYASQKHGVVFKPSQFMTNIKEPRGMTVTLVKSNTNALKEGVTIHLSTSDTPSKNVSVMLSTSVKSS